MTSPKQRKAAKPRKAAVLAVRLRAPPAASHYQAEAYLEIPNGDGVLCANPGDFIVTDGDTVTVMPPERYSEALPDRLAG